MKVLDKSNNSQTNPLPNTPPNQPNPSQLAPKPSLTKAVPSSHPKKVLTSTSVIQKTRRKSIIRIKPKETAEKSKEAVHHGDEVFSDSQLQDKWKVYSEKIKTTAGGFSGSILVNCQPTLLEDKKTIHVIFRNETNELEFTRMSLDLLEYLKKELRNNHINITTEVNQAKAKKVLYTNRDKFDHLAKTNPKLNDWMEKLRLELK